MTNVSELERTIQQRNTIAFVLKYPTSRYWIASFYDATGRLHRRTTRETNRKRAQAVADQYERAAKGKGNPQRVRQIFHEFFGVHFGQDVPTTSVREYAERWLAARRAETAPGTHRRYGEATSKFLAHLGRRADRGLELITREEITSFRDSLLSTSAPATVNHNSQDCEDDLPLRPA